MAHGRKRRNPDACWRIGAISVVHGIPKPAAHHHRGRRVLRVNRRTVVNWIERGVVPYVELPGRSGGRHRYRIPLEGLLDSLGGNYDLTAELRLCTAGAVGIVLYDNPASSNAMKVRFLLAELGLDYERRNVSLKRPRPDWYLERYPFGTIPFFEDGDLELGESNAILRYLANRERRTDLYPAEPAARAAVDWALDAWSTQLRGAFFPAESIGLMHEDIDLGGGRAEDADQKALAEAIPPSGRSSTSWSGLWPTTGRWWVVHDRRIAFAPVLWRWYRLPLSFDPWPKVALLRDTVTARPAFAAMEPLA